jgi:hypothetical protein
MRPIKAAMVVKGAPSSSVPVLKNPEEDSHLCMCEANPDDIIE